MTSSIEEPTVVVPDSDVLLARTLPPVELSASVEHLAAKAVTRLGWHGTALPEMTLLGRRVVVVAQLLTEAHAERICLGNPPNLDKADVSTWVWPEFADTAPPAAVEIVGVLGVGRHWRTALATTAPFAKYCDTAMVLPWSIAMTGDYLSKCLPRAARHGVNVLTADPDGEVNLDQLGNQEPIMAQDSAMGRWVHELVYDKMLSTAR